MVSYAGAVGVSTKPLDEKQSGAKLSLPSLNLLPGSVQPGIFEVLASSMESVCARGLIEKRRRKDL